MCKDFSRATPIPHVSHTVGLGGGGHHVTHPISKATKLHQAGQGQGRHDPAISYRVGKQRLLRSNHGSQDTCWKSHFKKIGIEAREWILSRGSGTRAAHCKELSWAVLVAGIKTQIPQQALKTWKEKQAGGWGVSRGNLRAQMTCLWIHSSDFLKQKLWLTPSCFIKSHIFRPQEGKLYKWGSNKHLTTPYPKPLARSCKIPPFLYKKTHNYVHKPSESRESTALSRTLGFPLKGHYPSTEVWKGK